MQNDTSSFCVAQTLKNQRQRKEESEGVCKRTNEWYELLSSDKCGLVHWVTTRATAKVDASLLHDKDLSSR